MRFLGILIPFVLVGTAQSAIIVDFSSWTGANTSINNWTFTVELNGDGTADVSNGGSRDIDVSGTVSLPVTGTVTFTFDGTEADGVDTTVNLRTTGLGVTGRNAGRIDYNSASTANGGADQESEVMDVEVDASGLSVGSFSVVEVAFENTVGTNGPLITGFDGSEVIVAAGSPSATLGGPSFAVPAGDNDTMFFEVAYSDSGNNGYSLSSFTFDIIPEPTSLGLLVIGSLTTLGRRRAC